MGDSSYEGEYAYQSDHEKQREQDVSLFPADESQPLTGAAVPQIHAFVSRMLHDGFPSVSGMFCGGPLPTTSWMSTEVGEMRTTL